MGSQRVRHDWATFTFTLSQLCEEGTEKVGSWDPCSQEPPWCFLPLQGAKQQEGCAVPCLHRCTLNCRTQWLIRGRPLKCQLNSVSQSCQPKSHSWSWKQALQNQRIYQPPHGLIYCRGLRTKRFQAETLKKPFKNWSNRDFPREVQWLRLPMQGAQMWPLVRKLDPTCHS